MRPHDVLTVTQLAPRRREVPLTDLCGEEFLAREGTEPLAEAAVSVLGALSTALLGEPATRAYPELTALAFWLRPANLRRMVLTYRAGLGGDVVLAPRGLALHVAPANVDTIFVYSWALSFLAGNVNVVRVPGTQNRQLDHLLHALGRVLEDDSNRWVADRNVFLTYPHDDRISAHLCRNADIRVLWGGDDTVRHFRSFPARVTTKEIAFADKTSHCTIKAGAYLDLDADERREIGHRFFNDAYVFDQLACSSPRIVFFVGENTACEEASREFWAGLEQELGRRGREDAMPAAMDKLSFVHQLAARGNEFLLPRPLMATRPAVVRIPARATSVCRGSPGQGLFFECFVPELDSLVSLMGSEDQTLTHLGFSREELRAFVVRLGGRGIDRIVPIGAALDFHPIWDGYVLLTELTKHISIQGTDPQREPPPAQRQP